MINYAAHRLLWFRPLSVLKYALPESLADLPWVLTRHIPIDVLTACEPSVQDCDWLQGCEAWVLSSPSAAYWAARLGAPRMIAVMGTPSQTAWRDAGGAEPKHWHISPTGESMGLFEPLRHYPRVTVLRGKQGRNDLIQALLAAGIEVNPVHIYEKKQHPLFETDLRDSLCASTNISTSTCTTMPAFYFSSTDQVSRVLAAAKNTVQMLDTPVFVSHSRIASAAQALGFKHINLHEST